MMMNTTFAVITSLMLVLVSNATFAQDDTLGPLFHSPESRAALEQKRGIKPKPVLKKRVVTKAVKAPAPTLPLPDPIMLQGYVKRSDGPNTVWINHQPVRENSQTQSISVGRIAKHHQSKNNSLLAEQNTLNKIDQLSIRIPANGKIIQLKPGQRYVPEENRVDDITVNTIY